MQVKRKPDENNSRDEVAWVEAYFGAAITPHSVNRGRFTASASYDNDKWLWQHGPMQRKWIRNVSRMLQEEPESRKWCWAFYCSHHATMLLSHAVSTENQCKSCSNYREPSVKTNNRAPSPPTFASGEKGLWVCWLFQNPINPIWSQSMVRGRGRNVFLP